MDSDSFEPLRIQIKFNKIDPRMGGVQNPIMRKCFFFFLNGIYSVFRGSVDHGGASLYNIYTELYMV